MRNIIELLNKLFQNCTAWAFFMSGRGGGMWDRFLCGLFFSVK